MYLLRLKLKLDIGDKNTYQDGQEFLQLSTEQRQFTCFKFMQKSALLYAHIYSITDFPYDSVKIEKSMVSQ